MEPSCGTPSVVNIEVGGWMALQHHHSSSESSGENEVFQPVLKRKADKPAKPTRPSKVARVSEGSRIYRRTFLPSGDGKSSGHVGKPSTISQTRTHTETRQDSTRLIQSSPLADRTFVSTSGKQANVSNSQLEASTSTSKVTMSTSQPVRIGSMTSISRNFPPLGQKANSQPNPLSTLTASGSTLSSITSLQSEKGKETMSGVSNSSDSLPDPSKLVKDILELFKVERQIVIDVQKESLESVLESDSQPNHDPTSSQRQLEGNITSPGSAEFTRKRSKPNESENVPKVKHSVEYTVDSGGVIDLTLDDEEIVVPSPLIKSKKGKEKAATISNSVPGVTVEDESPSQRARTSKNRFDERDSVNLKRMTRQDRESRSINGDKGSGTRVKPEISSTLSASANINGSAQPSIDVIDLCSDSDDEDEMISALFPDSNSMRAITINDTRALSSGTKDQTAVHEVTPARMTSDSQAMPLSSTAESHSQLNGAAYPSTTPDAKLGDRPHETANIASITLPSCSPTTSEDAFKAIDLDPLVLMDIMDANVVGDLLTRIEETSIDLTRSDTPFVLRVSTPMRTVTPLTAVQPEDIPSDSRHARSATSPLNSLPEREDTPMDYVDWSPENLADSTTDTHTPTQQDDTQTMVQLGSKTSGSNRSNQSFDNSAPSSSASSMVTGSHSESSGPSFQFARKTTRAAQLSQLQNSRNDSGSSTSRTPEPQKPATPSTPSGRRIVTVKEPDYAKLRANIFEPLPKDNNELSAAIRWPAEKVPTLLHDMINRLPDGYLFNSYMKHIFESMIEENTVLDEPTAPPIQVIGTKNGPVTPPWEFYYANRIFHGQGVPRSDKQLLEGCGCIGPCNPKSKTCACVARQMTWAGEDKSVKGFLYKKGRLTAPGCPIFECNDACECSEECMNRVIQRGRKHSVSIMLTKEKGWGVFADEKILRGTYLGIYAGEMILEQEADERGKLYDKFGRTYLFDMDFYFLQGLRGERGGSASPSRKEDSRIFNLYTIDAFHIGNFTRFLNHSCDPNCQIIASYVNEPDLHKPTLTIFTSRDVCQGEELTFAYFGEDSEEQEEEEEVDEHGQKKVKVIGGPSSHKKKAVHRLCLCGAPNCRGEMF